MLTPTSIKKKTVLVVVTLYNIEGDPERTIAFKAKEVGSKASVVGHAHHEALLQHVIDYFELQGPVDRYQRRDTVAPTSTDGDGVLYTPVSKVYSNPENVWTIRLITHDRPSPVWAYVEDDGELAQEIRQQRRDKVANKKDTEATRRRGGRAAKPKTEPKVAQAATIDDLPLQRKPKTFEIESKALDVRVFGKLHREMKNPDGGERIPDPSKKRTPDDDVATYKATSYQLGKVSKVYQNKKAVIIVGANGVAILQMLRPGSTKQMEMLREALKEKGKFSGTITTI